MPQPLFLHIRARARGTTRVVEVATDLVRIGRGVDCDARLDDPLIADVECFLRRHGETWHVQPLSDRGRLTIDGRPVTHLRAIALGVPLRVGSTIVVLRETATSAAEFRPVEFQVDNDPVTETRTHASVDDDDRPLGDHPYDDPLKNLTRSRNAAAPPARDEPQPRRRVTTAERLWEAKWRAVGRSIQAQEARPVSTPISPKRAKVSEPAIVPFVPRHELEVRSKTAPPTSISDVEPVTLPITDLSHLETSVSQVSVHWGRSPDSVVTTAAGVVPFEPMHESVLAIELESIVAIPPKPREDVILRPQSEQDITPSRDFCDEEWPSVSSILSSQTLRAAPKIAAQRKSKHRPLPTASCEPDHWTPPRILVFLTSAAAIALVGTLGIFLTFAWGRDDSEAGMLADRLLRPVIKPNDIILETDVNPDGTWWKTTSGHLAIRAAALGSGQGGGSTEESAKFLLDTARAVAPLEPTTRMARADLEVRGHHGEVPISALGLSRDTLALALSARTLAQAGRTPSALAAYQAALEVGVKSEIGRGTSLRLADEAESKRFALPAEGLILSVVRDMAGQTGWTFETWSESLPNHGLVWLCAYRVLKERSAAESEQALTHLVESPPAPSMGSVAIHNAARAEGMAIKGRWQEANTLYNQAIAAMPETSVGRTWHLNRAVILDRGGDSDSAKEAATAARAGRGDDDIGQKVTHALDREGFDKKSLMAPTTRTKLKSN